MRLISHLIRHVASLLIALFVVCVLLWDRLPTVDGEIFPVVENFQVFNEERALQGVTFFVSFDKIRSCEFLGISWYNEDGVRLILEFEYTGSTASYTRPEGHQTVGPWLLRGVEKLEGTYAVSRHKCNPFFDTETRFYP